MPSEPTARWIVPLHDGNRVVEFEHGTASGKRVVRVNGKTIIHRDWMFRLVGDEEFVYGGTKFIIRVDPIPGLKYSYTLWVNGKSFTSFIQEQSKILETWIVRIGEKKYKVILDKNSLSVWMNGEEVQVENQFVDDGAEMIFKIDGTQAVIRSYSSQQKGFGIKYILFADGIQVTEKGLLSD
ncbi:fas apoptotic inhibitory molecule 1 isoform X2 [Microplitis mediator]|uniref:fas apoptotic inhibitory molecule 1 isoform X2 n=1 Tax=Microplitis mediator TaxID=375433 RepID=UPI002556B0B5|nr:fas apoptotic inhibitory molecule 1 isoform X2 [Microplitis mediator]